MNKAEKKSLIGLPIILTIGLAFALAGSNVSLLDDSGGLHPFVLSVLIAFSIQWIAFVPAFIYQTERYFDLVGSLSYVTVAFIAYLTAPASGGRAALLLSMVLIWALRLGIFLFSRIHIAGKDGRFDAMKPSFLRFGAAWTLQGLWITFTAAAALAAMSSERSPALDLAALLGAAVWLLGFCFEAIADFQKSRFKASPKNRDRFIKTGLWSVSRHPNYFGEILLWTGVAIVSFPALEGWQHWTLLSPVLVGVLLCKVSGIPLLEERASKKWGGQSDYEEYVRTTPVLIPRIFK